MKGIRRAGLIEAVEAQGSGRRSRLKKLGIEVGGDEAERPY